MAIAQYTPNVASELADVVEILRRSTVHVRSGRMGAGSGVVWQPDGLIVTNAHVVRADRAEVELADGRVFDGRVTARDPQRDLAAVQIEADVLPAASIGDSDDLRVGQLLVAVGNPLGMAGALAAGIVHTVGEREPGGQSWIRADIRLLPGNSGGPLADARGRVIGINSMVAGALGLAVPSNTVQRFLAMGAARPRLGLTMQPVVVPVGHDQQPGLLVLDVESGSPAERAGLIMGDIVLGVGGRRFQNGRQLLESLGVLNFGATVTLDLIRGGWPMSQTVILGPETSAVEAA